LATRQKIHDSEQKLDLCCLLELQSILKTIYAKLS